MPRCGEQGGEALSVRHLGAALGADPTAIYRYFRTMDELLLEIGDRLIGLSLRGFEPGPDWKETLRAVGRRTYAVYLEHPRVGMIVACRITGGPQEAAIIEMILGCLRQAGFDDPAAVRLYRTFGDLTLAFAAVLPDEARKADRARWTEAYGRRPGHVPDIASLAPLMAANAGMSTYESALDLLLESIDRQPRRT
jgi:AcrR family transcriptional regulator